MAESFACVDRVALAHVGQIFVAASPAHAPRLRGPPLPISRISHCTGLRFAHRRGVSKKIRNLRPVGAAAGRDALPGRTKLSSGFRTRIESPPSLSAFLACHSGNLAVIDRL